MKTNELSQQEMQATNGGTSAAPYTPDYAPNGGESTEPTGMAGGYDQESTEANATGIGSDMPAGSDSHPVYIK